MIILTENQYLKNGIENLAMQEIQNIKKQVMIFDVGERIFLSHKTSHSGCCFTNFFDILAKGVYIRKKDIDTTDRFVIFFNEYMELLSCSPHRTPSYKLSWREEMVLIALCSGYSPTELAKLLNKSVKTISTHKNNALKKLEMRNMQLLHHTFVKWASLTKELNPLIPRNKYTQDYFKL